jgi:hypothetical protein
LPIRVQRALFVRALIVLAATAGRDNPKVRVEISAEDTDLVIRAASPHASAFLQDAARMMGGDAIDTPGILGFRLPSLAEVRRREGS